MGTRKLISFDWALKKLLRSKANFGILEGFLSELLRDDIRILEVLDSESNKEDAQDKYNRVDLKVKNAKGEVLIIEVQYERELDYLQRILYATSRALIEQMHEGAPYADVVKVISINILYFDLGQGEDYVYIGRTRFLGLHKADELILSAQQQGLFPGKEYPWQLLPEYYLIKVNRFDDVAKDTLDEWIYFLKHEEIKDEFSAKGLTEAKAKLDLMKLPEAERRAYQRHMDDLHYQASMVQSSYGIGKIEGRKEGKEEGRKEGIEEGRKAGEDSKAREIARALKAQGTATRVIVEATGLSEVEIEGL
jgi:predicted transposase/invertase (TIGR01784 family)